MGSPLDGLSWLWLLSHIKVKRFPSDSCPQVPLGEEEADQGDFSLNSTRDTNFMKEAFLFPGSLREILFFFF